MPSTEPRPSKEWLAEVKRRGERIRRRRRLVLAAVSALALVLPAGAMITYLGDGRGPDLRVAASGPPPAAGAGGGAAEVPPEAPAVPPEEPATTTTTEVHERVAVINGSAVPRVPTTVPPADDPVVRTPTPTTTDPSGNASSPVSTVGPTATTAVSAPGPALAPCAASEVGVTVSTEKAVYAPGETVRASSVLENRSAAACLLPTRAFFRILDVAGKDVGSFAYTADFRYPVRAEPGKTFSSGVTWDQKDCSGPVCVQVPAGTYTAVADWTESGPYSGRTTFRAT